MDRLGRHRRGAARGRPGRSAPVDAPLGPLAGRPIPPFPPPEDWLRVPIAEGGEPLVALSAYAPDRVAVEPRYYQAGYAGALPECYLRASVAARLAEAARALPAGWRIVVYDGWRPVAVQRALYEEYKAELRQRLPDAPEAVLDQETRRYVALPSPDPASPSPHLTGGAVDLALLDATGRAVEMGTAYDACEPASFTPYFERRPGGPDALAPREAIARRHRRLLFHVLVGAGFTNYAEEWWHYEYERARYGPIPTLEMGLHGPPPRGWAGGYWYRSRDGRWSQPAPPAPAGPG